MKKNIKRISVLIIIVLALSLLATSLVACDRNKQKKHDPESRAFSMSINVPDGVFNPFYSSSADDSSVISLTQISMLSTDKLGNIVCGENEPTVTKSWWSNENKDDDGKVVTTSYEFLIKNGIKWPNGSDLTIKDVLFNLYVYLDPAYTGSATIYSTDIVGLDRYRSQKDDGDSSDFEAGFIQDAALRINNMIEYVQAKGKGVSSDNRPTLPDNLDTTKIVSDFVTMARLFYRELESDWNAINVEDYKEWGEVTPETANLPDREKKFEGIKDKWVIFFLNDGGYTQLLRKDKDNNFEENSKGNYIIDAEAREELLYTMASEWLKDKDLATIEDKIVDGKEVSDVTLNTSDADALEKAIKEYCINTVFSNYFPNFLNNEANADIITRNVDKFTLTNVERATVLDALIPNTNANQFELVARYWGSASTLLEQFTAEEKSEYFKTAERIAPNITGITVAKTNNFHGEALGSNHYVLCIDINDVDPKAIYNFSFTVAPMYNYSTLNWNGKNYIKDMEDDFAAWEAAYDKGENYIMSHFGLEFGSNDFMLEVVKPDSKNGVPVGGGPYMASSESGKESGVIRSDFLNNNMIYYVRNPYFNTVGAELENAKIKYVRFKVVDSDQIVNYLTTGNLDFGEPSATQANIDVLNGAKINHVEIKTNGYGYVGINPRYVPEVTIRRIIMSAMNTQLIVDDYYEGGLAELIKRPISKTSWAYPETANDYVARNGFEYRFNQSNSYNGKTIEQILEEDLHYSKGAGGVYEKNIEGFGKDRLDYKFTIAGGSTDHPAYAMFLEAVGYLNKHGFGVQVVTSQQALSDLSNGKLAVWAAAWSSTIDPDMYQVYHKDSQASSVKNWGYPQILGMTSDAAWGDELGLVEELSKQIDLGRSYTDQNRRKGIYANALNIIMELAVEFPTYQRNDMSAYQKDLLDPKTLPSKDDCSPYSGLLARIWEINYL